MTLRFIFRKQQKDEWNVHIQNVLVPGGYTGTLVRVNTNK